MSKKEEPYLRVYSNRSEYYTGDGSTCLIFEEGQSDTRAKERIKEIRLAFSNGFLSNIIESVKKNIRIDTGKISSNAESAIIALVNEVTSEVGRALIGLSVMQLTIKAINNEQSIRLHKGGEKKGSFSWKEGISMRTLDKAFVTPVLRKHNLLKLNADGFMMTRSLAENYPYTNLYKANLRGAKQSWLTLVEEIESSETDPLETLKLIIKKLYEASDIFKAKCQSLISAFNKNKAKYNTLSKVKSFMIQHMESSTHAARLMEISMHALMQAAEEHNLLGDFQLQPLSQMRSANKKHGNIGDIELLQDSNIIEAWDAKFGKTYLRDEIEEVCEKLDGHPLVKTVGFVTSENCDRIDEIQNRINELSDLHGVDIKILSFAEWVDLISSDSLNTNDFALSWIQAYIESLCLMRIDKAPIDEPSIEWVDSAMACMN